MTRILVTGASGLLGLNFALQQSEVHEIIGVVNSHSLSGVPFQVVQKDLAQAGSVQEIFADTRPEVVLHCAAMANIDHCESNPELARRVNAEVPKEFAEEARKQDVKLVYISTDAVFDGQKGGYSEDDEPNPLSVYAETKLEGERLVQTANPETLIARVNFYGWSLRGQRSLSEFFFNNLTASKPMMGFTDVNFCPLLVNDLVEVLVEMVRLDLAGVYHTLSSECLNKYEFGCLIADTFGFDRSLIKPVSVYQSNLKAARSPNLTLSTTRLSNALGHELPTVRQGVNRLFELYQTGFTAKIQSFSAG